MIGGTHALFDFGPLANHYDRWYETADGKAHDRNQKAEVRQALPSPARGARLLDVGCGTGHWSRFFASLGFGVTGVDVSVGMVAKARSRNTAHSGFSVADGCRLPFGDGVFDVVCVMAVVEFVSYAEGVVAEVFRCARKGGVVIIGTLNRLAPLNRRRVEAMKAPYSSAHFFSPTELRDLLAPYGTLDIRVSDEGHGDGRKRSTGAFIVASLRAHMGEDSER